MNRIQKKCFIASMGFHLSLVLILVVGPAFLSSSKKSEERPTINFVALKTIDEALSGGGNPNASPPAPQPPAPQPVPQPPPEPVVQQPDPPKPVVREPDSFDTKPTKKLPDVSLKPVTRSQKDAKSKQKSPPAPDSETKAAEERNKKLASALRATTKALQGGLSSSTSIELPGPGGGGVPYANFLDGVKKVYSDAWLVPDEVTDDEATATASVTIGRDGTVIDARIVGRSGNALADQSVEAVLRRVSFAVPLPEGAKENQRTLKIKFNVKAKRGLG